MAAEHPKAELYLICRSAGHLCALPLERVREIMRPLPLERTADAGAAGAFVLGAAIVRGAVVPVLSLAALMGRHKSDNADAVPFGRYVSLRLGPRHAVLAVESVLGIRALEAVDAAEPVAPLIGMVEHEAVAAITIHDAELLFVLQAAKLVPESAWAELDDAETAV